MVLGKPSALGTMFQPVCLSSSYDHEGRLTNVTRPTGVVTSLHREMEKSITIDIENSNRDDDVTVVTNLSSVEASYTVVQGKPPHTHRHPPPNLPPGPRTQPSLRSELPSPRGPSHSWSKPQLAVSVKGAQQTNSRELSLVENDLIGFRRMSVQDRLDIWRPYVG